MIHVLHLVASHYILQRIAGQRVLNTFSRQQIQRQQWKNWRFYAAASKHLPLLLHDNSESIDITIRVETTNNTAEKCVTPLNSEVYHEK